jgi:hypothetical protein
MAHVLRVESPYGGRNTPECAAARWPGDAQDDDGRRGKVCDRCMVWHGVGGVGVARDH